MSGLLAYVQDQQQYIGLLLLSHIQLTLLSVAIAVCIGVPLGLYSSERERLLRPVMGFAYLAQAIPSLALLGFLVPYRHQPYRSNAGNTYTCHDHRQSKRQAHLKQHLHIRHTDTLCRFQRVGADIAQTGTGIFQNGQQ